MKIKLVLISLMSLSILGTACSHNMVKENEIIAAENNQKENGGEDMPVEMTQEQKTLLKKNAVDEDAVERGELFSWQKEILRQYDYAMEYLKGKYPSYSFHIVDVAPKNKLNPYTTFEFTEENSGDKYYELYLDIEEQYSARDNFYGKIIGPKYEEQLMTLLQAANIPCDRVEARFNAVADESFNEELDVNEIIKGNIVTNQTVFLHINSQSLDGASYEEVYKQIHEYIDTQKINGYFIVIIYDGEIDPKKEVSRESFKAEF